MRITDPQVIVDGEKDLIASVQRDIDLDAVRDLLKERLTAKALSPRGGRIVVHDNEVAFRLDYEINLNGSLLFDREGNLLEDSDGTLPEQENLQDDDLSINLPDYNDEPEEKAEQLFADDDPEHQELSDDIQDTDIQAPDNLESDIPDSDVQDAEPGLEIEDLEDDSGFNQDDSDILDVEDGDELIDDLSETQDLEDLSVGELPDIDLEDENKQDDQGAQVDDISDILQESRDFWEKKQE